MAGAATSWDRAAGLSTAASHSHWEDDAVVVTAHRYHAGHELVIEERMRLVDDGARLTYSHSVTGPDATNDMREITFVVLG